MATVVPARLRNPQPYFHFVVLLSSGLSFLTSTTSIPAAFSQPLERLQRAADMRRVHGQDIGVAQYCDGSIPLQIRPGYEATSE